MSVVVLVVVVSAGAVLTVFVVMLMVVVPAGAMLTVFVVVVVTVMTTAGGALLLSKKLFSKCTSLLHGGKQLCAGQLVPRGCDDGGVVILLAQECDSGIQLLGTQVLSAAENDSTGVLHLIGVEFTEVFEINLALGCVGYRNSTGECHIGNFSNHILHSFDDIGELTYARRLNENAVGVELLHDFFQSFAEIAHQRAADAAGVHLGDLHAGIL